MCDTEDGPTTKPRYTITDTGETAELLDLAAQAWPGISDRRKLLTLVLGAGRGAVERDLATSEERRERQRAALRRGNEGLDVELLLSGAAWR